MENGHTEVFSATGVDLKILAGLMRKPALFEPGETLFWDDPHISKSMLSAHLDQATDAASRPADVISRSAEWLMGALSLRQGSTLLDLGCGPGLYAIQFARRGISVTGVDFSRRSIDYARNAARNEQLAITYDYSNFLEIPYRAEFDAAVQIYGEISTFAPETRDTFLKRIHTALQPRGRLAFDVSTRAHRAKYGMTNQWYAVSGPGFWRDKPHLVLEHGFDYPEHSTYCDQYIVIEPGGTLTIYRNWFVDYTPEAIRQAVEAQGFMVEGLYADLQGTPYHDDSEWIGVLAVAR